MHNFQKNNLWEEIAPAPRHSRWALWWDGDLLRELTGRGGIYKRDWNEGQEVLLQPCARGVRSKDLVCLETFWVTGARRSCFPCRINRISGFTPARFLRVIAWRVCWKIVSIDWPLPGKMSSTISRRIPVFIWGTGSHCSPHVPLPIEVLVLRQVNGLESFFGYFWIGTF